MESQILKTLGFMKKKMRQLLLWFQQESIFNTDHCSAVESNCKAAFNIPYPK